MADWTKAQLALDALERLRVKAPGQPASAEITLKVEAAADGLYSKLRKLGLAPFGIDAIPPWAQTDVSRWLAAEVAELFGANAVALAKGLARDARRSLAEQVAMKTHKIPIRGIYY